jgi:hypothetical protein
LAGQSVCWTHLKIASSVQLAPCEEHVVFPRRSTQHWFDVRGHGVPQRTTPASVNCTLLGTLWSPEDDPESREEEPLPEPELLDFEPLEPPELLDLPLELLPEPELLPDPLDPVPELVASSSELPPSSAGKPPVFLLAHPAKKPPAIAPARRATHRPVPKCTAERAAIESLLLPQPPRLSTIASS